MATLKSKPSYPRGMTLPPALFSHTATHVDNSTILPSGPPSSRYQDQPGSTRKLIVVSNRLPITIKRCPGGRYEYHKSCGGLVTGMSGLDQDTNFRWYGWPGLSASAEELSNIEMVLEEEHNAVLVLVDDRLADMHYNGFSNSTLWPLLHYQGCFTFQKNEWKAYKEVNQIFAARLAADCADGDLVWIHDYHLLLLPAMLRKEAAKMKKSITIGFFLHTHFPASDQFKILPVCKDLLSGMLSSDLIGFHTASYAENFRGTCADVLKLKPKGSGFWYEDHFTQIGDYPIGIDPEKIYRELAKPEVQARAASLRNDFGGDRLIVGVDRLDYIKGLPRKVQALDQFLSENPQWVGKATLVQVVVPSRENIPEYQELAKSLHALVDSVNQRHGYDGYKAVNLLHRSVPFDELVALYAAADACLISSTRDGMNLVAFEYIASQRERKGVLLLSEFAGAAELLRDSVRFNPWDLDDMVESIGKALTMDKRERVAIHEKSEAFVKENNSAAWGRSFVSDLQHLATLSWITTYTALGNAKMISGSGNGRRKA